MNSVQALQTKEDKSDEEDKSFIQQIIGNSTQDVDRIKLFHDNLKDCES